MEQKKTLRRAAAVQDLSGFGRCSLTVALPILSAMGVQCSCLPTAVLSTHTGGFKGYTFRDLTEDMEPFFRHWQKENFAFDALYTGYLGSLHQLEIVQRFFDAFQTKENITLVDPVMGDHGVLYSRFDDRMVRGIRALCARADVMVPNLTEAAFLTDTPYRPDMQSEQDMQQVCEKLLALGAKQVVLTGVRPEKELLGAACHDGKHLHIYARPHVPKQYDGTGDVFASVLLGSMLQGNTLQKSMEQAADFTRICVQKSLENGTDMHHGVDFEMCLPLLIGMQTQK